MKTLKQTNPMIFQPVQPQDISCDSAAQHKQEHMECGREGCEHGHESSTFADPAHRDWHGGWTVHAPLFLKKTLDTAKVL